MSATPSTETEIRTIVFTLEDFELRFDVPLKESTGSVMRTLSEALRNRGYEVEIHRIIWRQIE